jgi:Fic family protein
LIEKPTNSIPRIPYPRIVADPDDRIRHSSAFEADLISDPDEKTAQEARNGLRQIDEVAEMVESYTERGLPFKFRLSAVLHLHRVALEGISSYAGNFRPPGIEIGGSRHAPPGAHLVPELVEEMCDYVNEHWATASALHLAAYVLWRLNWIHPFTDGNGRTARAVSYLMLCLRIGHPLYGANSVPAQIAQDKAPYYEALEAADSAYSERRIDVGRLEQLLETLLARQLLGVLEGAAGYGIE